MTEKSFDTIASVLIDSKIIAMKFNEDGINDAYIENINSTLSELKEMKNNGKIIQWNVCLSLERKVKTMKEYVNVKELLEEVDAMAKRGTLLARGGVTQEDLAMQIIGLIVHVAMKKENGLKTEECCSAMNW